MNTEAKLPGGRPRFVWLTWGQHIGVSEYAYCRHVLCVGVLRRDVLDIASNIAGQRNELLAREAADPAEVNRVVLSEMFHNVVQAAGRGACRTTRNGAAERMTLTLLCVETFPVEWWQEAMPGVIVEEIQPSAKVRAAKISAEHRAVIEKLGALPGTDNSVSLRTLKTLAGLQSMRPDAYSRMVAKLKVPGWRRDGRSFYRCPF